MAKVKLTSLDHAGAHEPELEPVPFMGWKHIASLKVSHPGEWEKWHHASEGDLVTITIEGQPPITIRKVTIL